MHNSLYIRNNLLILVILNRISGCICFQEHTYISEGYARENN